jgi:PPOX class probable F420-dependent enzyme
VAVIKVAGYLEYIRNGAAGMQIDTSTEFGRRVEQRLQDDIIIWLTTVGSDGQPVSVPVWFYWDGESVLIYSQPNKPKLRHIVHNPNVSLNFNCDEYGGNVIQFDGGARIDDSAPPATGIAPMMQKYEAGIKRIGTTPEGFASAFSVPVRVTLEKVRGH